MFYFESPPTQHHSFLKHKLFFQGMSYLHAKGIVLPALTAMNVFLESKVKLCVSGYCNRTTRVER